MTDVCHILLICITNTLNCYNSHLQSSCDVLPFPSVLHLVGFPHDVHSSIFSLRYVPSGQSWHVPGSWPTRNWPAGHFARTHSGHLDTCQSICSDRENNIFLDATLVSWHNLHYIQLDQTCEICDQTYKMYFLDENVDSVSMIHFIKAEYTYPLSSQWLLWLPLLELSYQPDTESTRDVHLASCMCQLHTSHIFRWISTPCH